MQYLCIFTNLIDYLRCDNVLLAYIISTILSIKVVSNNSKIVIMLNFGTKT